ncbi:hypothetical protein TgHK011_009983 [Trichoderma gracile]|nr:hypothetical protein TgHK011_009983 [Trichoderma gracile]
MQAPVEEGPAVDERVRERRRLGLVLEVPRDLDLGREDGQLGGELVGQVAAELGGQEALHAGGNGGVDERLLLVLEGGGADGGHDGVLAGEGGGQRVDGAEVGFDDADAGGECGRGGGVAAEDGDGEFVGGEERGEEDLANVAAGADEGDVL